MRTIMPRRRPVNTSSNIRGKMEWVILMWIRAVSWRSRLTGSLTRRMEEQQLVVTGMMMKIMVKIIMGNILREKMRIRATSTVVMDSL